MRVASCSGQASYIRAHARVWLGSSAWQASMWCYPVAMRALRLEMRQLRRDLRFFSLVTYLLIKLAANFVMAGSWGVTRITSAMSNLRRVQARSLSFSRGPMARKKKSKERVA